jgi:hypothetical protein
MTSAGIMPWIALACAWLLGACVFDADYSGGTYKCSDGVCPTGLRCVAGACTSAPIDAHVDGPKDGPPPALTCADPGPASGSVSGTTVGRSNTVSASCGGFVMNGQDAVYRVSATAGQHVMVSVAGLQAYVIAPCVTQPQTPTCLGNTVATVGNPISVVAATTGNVYVIIDDSNPAVSGSYTLDVTVGP